MKVLAATLAMPMHGVKKITITAPASEEQIAKVLKTSTWIAVQREKTGLPESAISKFVGYKN